MLRILKWLRKSSIGHSCKGNAYTMFSLKFSSKYRCEKQDFVECSVCGSRRMVSSVVNFVEEYLTLHQTTSPCREIKEVVEGWIKNTHSIEDLYKSVSGPFSIILNRREKIKLTSWN